VFRNSDAYNGTVVYEIIRNLVIYNDYEQEPRLKTKASLCGGYDKAI
jgi:hypothetical protein